jgi:hypothetical protein
MKSVNSGSEDWLSRQTWIPIAVIAVAVIGGWAVISQPKQIAADKDSQAQLPAAQPVVQAAQPEIVAVPPAPRQRALAF